MVVLTVMMPSFLWIVVAIEAIVADLVPTVVLLNVQHSIHVWILQHLWPERSFLVLIA